MPFYGYEEEEVWKCLKHPSRQRPRNGICPICLHDRLITLCPDCANVRPCACCPANTTTPSSSSSSVSDGAPGESGPLSSLIDDGQPNNFRRSRSVAVQFLRSRLAGDRESGGKFPPAAGNRSNSSIWSVFRTHKSKKGQEDKRGQEEVDDYEQRVVMRSRSVGVAAKGRGWYFPSPIKAFRQSKTSKVVQER